MNNKEFYIDNLPENIPIFHKPWWLNVVCENWDVALHVENKQIKAYMPYCYKMANEKCIIYMPPLTQFIGPKFFHAADIKNEKRISDEIKLQEELFKQLPEFTNFNQRWHFSIQNWLSLYWEGYRQTTRYTYYITDTSDIGVVWDNLNSSTRQQIRKGENRLTIRQSDDVNLLYSLIHSTFTRQDKEVDYSKQMFFDLATGALKNDAGTILIAYDADNTPCAGALFVKDSKAYYYLAGGMDENLKENAAMSILQWEGIKLASQSGLSYDFEGSMLQHVERFFRKFGGDLMPYYDISKVIYAEENAVFKTLKKIIRG